MAKRASKGKLSDFVVSSFGGLNTSLKNLDAMTPGTSPDSLNWMTGAAEKDGKYYGDHIELRRGTAFLNGSDSGSSTPVSGLTVGIKQDGTQVPFFTSGRKLFYYDITTNTYIESGSDLLPDSAINDDVSVLSYQSFSGNQILLSSPNSSIYKVMVTNPINPINLNSLEYRGYISANQSRLMLWNRKGLTSGNNINDLFVSAVDGSQVSYMAGPNNAPYTYKTGVIGATADGVTKTFTGTITKDLAIQTLFTVSIVAPIATPTAITAITKAASAKVTSAGHGLAIGDIVSITGVLGMTEINNLIVVVTSVISSAEFEIGLNTNSFTAYTSGGFVGKDEAFRDDGNGNLTSLQGGTGNINYSTGVYTVTFNTAPINTYTLLLSYNEEDSTKNSLAYFVPDISAPVASHPSIYGQPGFGPLMNVFPLSGILFCIHQFGTYQLSIVDNDVTQSSQIIYRNGVGIPYWRAGFATGDGILYLDTLNQANPTLRQLVMQASTSGTNPAIIPDSISDQLDLTINAHDRDVVYEWGDYYVLECKALTNGVADTANNRMYLMNKKTGAFDLLDLRSDCFANYYGALLAGDSISGNPLILFSGFDDLGYNINNYWKSAPSFLGAIGIKTFNKFVVKGLIQPSQNLGVYLSFDGGQPVKWGDVDGDGKYVNKGVPLEVGGPTMGTNVVGGGGTVYAYPYEMEITIGSDHFNRVSVMFKAEPKLDEDGMEIDGSGVGYVSVDEYTLKDIRYKSSHIMNSNVE